MTFLDPFGFCFEAEENNNALKSYMYERNKQIVQFKKEGMSWLKIARKVGLSRLHVKRIGHKLNVYGKFG